MIKNIHGHNFYTVLFFLIMGKTLFAGNPVITVPDFSCETVKKIQAFSELHKGQFTINVAPFSYSDSLYKLVSYPWNMVQTTFSGYSLISFAMSFGWISYLLCAYLTYRVYQLLKKATSWSTWCSDEDLIKNDHEYLFNLLHKQTMHRAQQRPIKINAIKEALQKEALLLQRYKIVITFLTNYKLLNFFPYVDEVTQKKADLAYKKIVLAQHLIIHA